MEVGLKVSDVTRRFAGFSIAVAIGSVALIVVDTVGNGGRADGTTLGLFVLAVVLLFAALVPDQTLAGLRRITSVRIGSVELGLLEIKRAERLRPPFEDDGVGVKVRPKAEGFVGVVEELKRRLDGTQELIDLKAGKGDYAGIVSELRAHDLLRQDEEFFVLDLLQERDPVSDEWSSATKEAFLDAAWAFAVRFRALIWARHVRDRLRSGGRAIAEFRQDTGHRPDFLAFHSDSWSVIAARVGAWPSESPENLDGTAIRLAQIDRLDETLVIDTRVIVMPDVKRGILSEECKRQSGGRVVMCKLDEVLDGG